MGLGSFALNQQLCYLPRLYSAVALARAAAALPGLLGRQGWAMPLAARAVSLSHSHALACGFLFGLAGVNDHFQNTHRITE